MNCFVNIYYSEKAINAFKKAIGIQPNFFKAQASESLLHATLVGEHITGLGGHPPLNITDIKETFKHDITEILKETLSHEKEAIKVYYELLNLVQDKSVY